MELDELSNRVIGCAIEAHREVGPGVLESPHEPCVAHHLKRHGIAFHLQPPQRFEDKGIRVDFGCRVDAFVEETLIPRIAKCRADQGHSHGAAADLHEAGRCRALVPDCGFRKIWPQDSGNYGRFPEGGEEGAEG